MKHDLSKIPSNPGCYIYKNKSGKIIYIGKAKNLKKRVSSYFNKKDHNSKTKILVNKINKIDFIVTESEIEALLLENNLIKKNKPKYNIDLKDSKSFAFIEVTNEKFPRLLITRADIIKKKKSGSKFYGPFVSGTLRDEVRYVLNKTFKIRTCKRLPKKKCIRYDIGICSAPCINKISKVDYRKDIGITELILKGKNKELLKKLNNKMKDFAKNQNFEEALRIRNQSLAIKYLNEKQNVERVKKYNEDIINYIIKDNKVYLILFNISKGILENKQSFTFDFEEDFLEKFISQYYEENDIPKRIIVPKKIDEVINKFLEYKRKSKVKIIIPKIGEETTLTIRLENFGDGNANSVKANIDIPFFGIKDAFLGELESGDDSSAVFTIIPDKSGSIDYNLVVIYKDDFGEHTFNEKLKLNVQEDRNKNNILTIVGIVLLLLLIGYLIYSKSKKSNKLNMGK